jgi:protein-S-isoprenylcysteine O-methyltransferase Ste14
MSHAIRLARSVDFTLTIDLVERLLVLSLFGLLSWRMLLSFLADGNLVSLLVLLSEGMVALFIIIRAPTQIVSFRPYDWFLAVAATVAPSLAAPGGAPLLPEVVAIALIWSGFVIQTSAKLTLRRSFGIVAANRGVRTGGPYRLVRHPMYAGYMLAHAGFLLYNPTLWNLGLYLFAETFQVMRLLAEERLLAGDPDYRRFAAQVRYRLVPGLF